MRTLKTGEKEERRKGGGRRSEDGFLTGPFQQELCLNGMLLPLNVPHVLFTLHNALLDKFSSPLSLPAALTVDDLQLRVAHGSPSIALFCWLVGHEVRVVMVTCLGKDQSLGSLETAGWVSINFDKVNKHRSQLTPPRNPPPPPSLPCRLFYFCWNQPVILPSPCCRDLS